MSFKKIIINDLDNDLFKKLIDSVVFEDITKGRKGAVLTLIDDKSESIPIVRTTTVYKNPAQKFLPIHFEIIKSIKSNLQTDIEFNNALIEVYDNSYYSMGFHSDQSLDLEDDSYICLFSCYENDSNIRTLKIQNKQNKECSEIKLDNNSAVLFSTHANHKHMHKIVLDLNVDEGRWLGITFRLSKTFVKFEDNVPFINGKILTLATEEQKKEFYKHKSKENKSSERYIYPEIDYTISESDVKQLV